MVYQFSYEVFFYFSQKVNFENLWHITNDRVDIKCVLFLYVYIIIFIYL